MGVKLDSLFVGSVQLFLAAMLAFYPFDSVITLTLSVALAMMLQGIVRFELGVGARKIPGSVWTRASAIGNVVLSALVILALPQAEVWEVGLLAGVNLVHIGAARIGIAWEGRRFATVETGKKME